MRHCGLGTACSGGRYAGVSTCLVTVKPINLGIGSMADMVGCLEGVECFEDEGVNRPTHASMETMDVKR